MFDYKNIGNYIIDIYFQEADIYVPDDATVTGNCDNENTVTMSLKWKAFVLSWSFAKVIFIHNIIFLFTAVLRDNFLGQGIIIQEIN